MPAYCFECEKCGQGREVWLWIAQKPETPECHNCQLPMERDYHAEHFGHKPASAFPYWTSNITGEPIEVKSSAHQAELCKLHGVRLRDDSAWIDEQVETEAYKTKDGQWGTRPRYTRGNGRGMPGSWF